MKRTAVLLALIIPVAWLLVFAVQPDWDVSVTIPVLHFYLVTFFTFAAVVVALLIGFALGEESLPRHRLLATAFAAMGAIFFIHGATTPGAVILTFNPGIRWAAWLTLFTGGLLFTVATFDRPGRPLPTRTHQAINRSIIVLYLVFAAIVVFRPGILTTIDERADPIHAQLVFWLTLMAWAYAAGRFTSLWRKTGESVDGIMALIAVWLALATVSMHQFATWQLSWWLYHVLLLAGALTAVAALAGRYEQLRRFRLTSYYAAIGLVVTALLALLASYGFSQIIAEELLTTTDMETAVVQARLWGLIIAGLSLGGLFVGLFFVVRRADRLIAARTAELAQAYADLQAAEALRDDLTDMIVHDLRSPLTAIDLSVHLLGQSLNDPEKAGYRTKFISNTQKAIQQMLGLVNQLLDITKLEAGKLELHREPLDVASILASRAAAFAQQAEATNVSLAIKDGEPLPPIAADAELLGRVIDNLIGNALKFTPAGGKVTLATYNNNRALLVQVQDTGAGIPQQELSAIFDKYRQVRDDTGRPARPGTGLGLSFCKLVVEAHGGRIWAESAVGAGSTISFTLPKA